MIRIHVFPQLPSTNDYLKENYATYHEDCAIVATSQTAGRGRFDRVWQSGDDLTFSILMHQSATYSILAPLAVVRALVQLGYETQIKWPNDILYQGKKCCGILVEDIYEGNEYACSIIGIGINVAPKLGVYGYIPVDKDRLLAEVINQWNALLKLPLATCLEAYRTYSYLIHKTIQLADGLWKVYDVSEEGYLLVEQDHHKKALNSEEVTLTQIYKEE